MAKPPQQSTSGDPCFENCLEELEAIVAQLEAGEKPLDESLALYEKGVTALKHCHQILDKAEQRIRLLVRGPGGEPTLREAEVQPHSGSSPRSSSSVRHTAPSAPSAPAEDDIDVEVEAETEIEPPVPPVPPAPTEKRGAKPSSRRNAGEADSTLFPGER